MGASELLFGVELGRIAWEEKKAEAGLKDM